MDTVDDRLNRERKKLAWLMAKVEEQRTLVQTLEALTGRPEDPLDRLFEEEYGATDLDQADALVSTQLSPQLAPSPLRWSWKEKSPPKSLPEHWRVLLGYIGQEGKSASQLEEFLKTEGMPMTSGAMRTGLMNYRRQFGLIENPRKGYYRLSESGLAFVSSLKEESPAPAGSGTLDLQPTPLAGESQPTGE